MEGLYEKFNNRLQIDFLITQPRPHRKKGPLGTGLHTCPCLVSVGGFDEKFNIRLKNGFQEQ